MSTKHYIIAHQRMYVFQYDVQIDIVNSIVNGHITEKGKNGKISNTAMNTEVLYITGATEKRQNQ